MAEHTTSAGARGAVGSIGEQQPPPPIRLGEDDSVNSEPESVIPSTLTPKDVSEGWQALDEGMEKHEGDMLAKWRSELENLLVFAGLFSAVVTAFTVESYKWLQRDPSDTSARLLANISMQLSSFLVAPNVVNSTFQVPATNYAATRFEPDTLSVNVNTLWIASLSLSLVAAFYAIAVLQWLRCIPIPPTPTYKMATRFRQFRHNSLDRWHVTTIVSLLPILMQIAVGLFFLGLFILLQSLNRTVSITLAVLVGIPLLFFGFSVVAPIIWSDCPYKSPIIPTAQMFLMHLLRPFYTAFYHISGYLIQLFQYVNYSIFYEKQPRRTSRLNKAANSLYSRLKLWHLRHTPHYLAANIEQFWNNRDRAATRDPSHDIPALKRAAKLLPGDKLNKAIPCLDGVDQSPRISIALDIALRDLGGRFTSSDYINYSSATFVNPTLLDQVDADYVEVAKDYLCSLLPDLWSTFQEEDGFTTVLLLLEKIAVVESKTTESPETLKFLSQHALELCCGQDAFDFVFNIRSRYPPEVLYRCIVEQGYKLDADEQTKILEFSSSVLQEYRWVYDTEFIEPILACSACALRFDGPTTPSPDDITHIRGLIEVLGDFVAKNREEIRHIGSTLLVSPGHRYVTPHAINTIAQALPKLASVVDSDDSFQKLKGALDDLRRNQPAFGDASNTSR